MSPPRDKKPSWDRLFEVASHQDGLFTTSQAQEAGYSPQLLAHHLRSGRIARVRRAIYRLVHFPLADSEDLTALWLWSERRGAFSHETALMLHQLSDALPRRPHLTLPCDWRRRRLRVPAELTLYYADIEVEDRAWFGAVHVTSPRRAVVDCAAASVSPELVAQAVDEGLYRGLFTLAMIAPAVDYLAEFGVAVDETPTVRDSPSLQSRGRTSPA